MTRSTEYAAFCDGDLPHTEAEVDTYFGSASTFLDDQYRFHPVDRCKVDVNFDAAKNLLRRMIDQEATIHCESTRNGVRQPERLADIWSPEAKVKSLFETRSRLVQDLYVGLKRLQQSLPDNPRDLRDYSDNVLTRANEFYTGIASRERILAILIFSGASSTAWETFVNYCLDVQRANTVDLEVFNDATVLPFTVATARKYFGDDYYPICQCQTRFCPIHLSDGVEVDWSDKETLPVLPLRKKDFIDSGAFGEVYRVFVGTGYYDGGVHEKALAMKEIDAGSRTEHTEWQLARKVRDQENTRSWWNLDALRDGEGSR